MLIQQKIKHNRSSLQRLKRRGMTMIEVAVAVGLSTILVVMLYGTFWTQITQLRTQVKTSPL